MTTLSNPYSLDEKNFPNLEPIKASLVEANKERLTLFKELVGGFLEEEVTTE
ncbi:MAG: hypothetical protein SNF33_06380 [Candidatus Algichlamydia australiensis]|nr:hypothetical protein [Chlamydiales bacterium]